MQKISRDSKKYQYIVIGGGFFGCYAAVELARKAKDSVIIIERESDLLQRASFNNQARVHRGYHYPRSILTGLCSSVNFKRFISDFKGSIYNKFEQYYAIGKIQSKVTASQYRTFCSRIGAPLKSAPRTVKALFNKALIEDVFLTQEYAFDAVKLKEIMFRSLEELGVPILFATEAIAVSSSDGPAAPLKVVVEDRASREKSELYAGYVLNCTYSNINTILSNSKIARINLKQEFTEMIIVEVPGVFKNKGVTIMCGPFFSLMPFPPGSMQHIIHHVRFTPHHYWYDRKINMDNQCYFDAVPRKTHFFEIIQDVKRYLPGLAGSRYIRSLWEIKTILPENEFDDGRPILFKKDAVLKNLICIMGGKIDNVYELEDELSQLY